MKKISILVASAFVFLLSFISCSSDDDSSGNIGSVIGKWNYASEKTSVNGTVVYDEVYEHQTGCEKDYYEILENGTAIDGEYFGASCTLTTFSDTYTRSGNTLTVEEGGETVVYQIVVANSTKMVLRTSESFEGITALTDFTYTK